jgi:hypothetical protein
MEIQRLNLFFELWLRSFAQTIYMIAQRHKQNKRTNFLFAHTKS